MAVPGVFTSDASIAGDRTGDFANFVQKVIPGGDMPFFKLSAGMKSESATDYIVNWFEENYVGGEVNISPAVADGVATSVTVSDSSIFVVGDIVEAVATGEYLYITANNTSTNVLTVVRGFAGTTAAAIGDNTKMQHISRASEENSEAPQSISYLGHPQFNYMQIIRSAWAISGSAKAIEYRTGNKANKVKMDAVWQHSMMLERSLLWGKKTLGMQNNKRFSTMDGIFSMIKTNVTVAGGTTTRAQMEDFLQGVFTYNLDGYPNERIAFMDNRALRVLNDISWLNSTFNMEDSSTTFGMKVIRWRSPFGEIALMTHPIMNGGSKWLGQLLLFHPGAVKKRILRATSTDEYNKDSGTDGDTGGLLTELSIEYKGERTGGQLKGLTAAA